MAPWAKAVCTDLKLLLVWCVWMGAGKKIGRKIPISRGLRRENCNWSNLGKKKDVSGKDF